MVVHLGLVDLVFYIPSSCPAPQPILPHFQLPKQNEAGCGTPKIIVNPTQVHNHLPNPVFVFLFTYREPIRLIVISLSIVEYKIGGIPEIVAKFANCNSGNRSKRKDVSNG